MAKLTFKKAFTDLKKIISKTNTKGFNDFAFQFVIEGEGEGTFYAACKDGVLSVEPYNYEDNTATFKATAATFGKLVAGEVAPDAAIAEGALVVEGGDAACAGIFDTIAGKKPAKKAAAKKEAAPKAAKAPKAAAKPAAKKTAAKKAEAPKAEVKAEAPKAEAKTEAPKAAAKPAVKKAAAAKKPAAPKAEAKAPKAAKKTTAKKADK